MAPEQLYQPDRIGTAVNVWACGAIMYYLMTGHYVQHAHDVNGAEMCDMDRIMTSTTRAYGHNLGQPRYRSFGPAVLGSPYSEHLIQLVLRCLARNQQRRPEARALCSIIAPIITTYDTMNLTDPNGSVPVSLDLDGMPNILPNGYLGPALPQQPYYITPFSHQRENPIPLDPSIATPQQAQANLLFNALPRRAPAQPNPPQGELWYHHWPWTPIT